jgi:hypothetical protein
MLSKEYNAEVLKLPSWVTLIFDTGKLLFLQALDFRTASFSFGPVDNGSWRCWQAESVWHLGFQKKHRRRWRGAYSGAALQSWSIWSISSHTSRIADNNSESMLT